MRKKIKILLRALGLSMRMKSKLSLAILAVGLPAALLPAYLATRLQKLTDALAGLPGNPGGFSGCLALFAGLGMVFLLSLLYRCLKDYAEEEDWVTATKYLKRQGLKCKCQVKYPYIENKDKFQERLERVTQFGEANVVRSVTEALGLASVFITFCSVAALLWDVNGWMVLLILATSVPAAVITYRQHSETFFNNLYWSETGAMVIYYYGVLAEEDFIQDLRHYNLYPYLHKEWRRMAGEHARSKRSILLKYLGMNSLADLLRDVVYLAVLGMTVWQIYQDPGLGLGLFALVFSLTAQMQTATSGLFCGASRFINSLSYIEEYFYVQDLEKEEQGEEKGIVENGQVEFDHVSFTYPESDREVLHDISVKIRDGEKIAIVGENGSGKSTFISLLCGMLEPDQGRILAGGADVAKETGLARNSISVVFQNFARYEDTLRNNIVISDREKAASCSKNHLPQQDTKLWRILEALHMEELVRGQKEGLDTRLGSLDEKGNNLSGGQWQKLAIARALYRDRGRIMILDEPTSALDPIAEAQLYKDFSRLTGDKTTLLISHRLGITSVVDRILVFRDGRIVEDGTHEELYRKGGEYTRMYQAQAKWYQ